MRAIEKDTGKSFTVRRVETCPREGMTAHFKKVERIGPAFYAVYKCAVENYRFRIRLNKKGK